MFQWKFMNIRTSFPSVENSINFIFILFWNFDPKNEGKICVVLLQSWFRKSIGYVLYILHLQIVPLITNYVVYM